MTTSNEMKIYCEGDTGFYRPRERHGLRPGLAASPSPYFLGGA